MSLPRVLYVCHNHPSVRPGGAEVYALELYEAMRASREFEPVLLAKGGPPMSRVEPHLGTALASINQDPNQYFFHTDGADFDWLLGISRQRDLYTKFLREFLEAYRPDIVHFQHTLFFGYDMICRTRNALPRAPIVYTLHEFTPICHRSGQMVRTFNQELCDHASPRRCHECFPEISPQAFFTRKSFIQSHFSLVDLFLAPSHLLLERFVEWGIPRAKIRYEPNGRPWQEPQPDSRKGQVRNRFGFFGQMNRFKGVTTLLEAVAILAAERGGGPPPDPHSELSLPAEDGESGNSLANHPLDFHLWLHGANLKLESGEFQNQIRQLLKATETQVTLLGRYSQEDLPRLMENIDWVVIPSIWWENSPLVIQEAFQHGRPVICSNVGGMAEKVEDEVNGLHFRLGDAPHLAETLRRAATEEGLWERLRAGIPDVYKIEDHASRLAGFYHSLIDQYQTSGGEYGNPAIQFD